MFPLETAKKLPVYFYGRVKFSDLSGSVEIKSETIRRAMIGFGQKFEITTRPKGIANIFLRGKLVFHSNAHIGNDYLIYIGENGYCEFGYMGCLGSDVKLVCEHKIIIGSWAGIGYESQLVDTNSHPMMNTLTGKHYPIVGEIVLGNFNAISNRVSIMMNTKTPDNCVIASNSLLNKDYRELGENILIGGIPAKLIRENFNRDWYSEMDQLKLHKRVKE